jgi:hypothetical protein
LSRRARELNGRGDRDGVRQSACAGERDRHRHGAAAFGESARGGCELRRANAGKKSPTFQRFESQIPQPRPAMFSGFLPTTGKKAATKHRTVLSPARPGKKEEKEDKKNSPGPR